MQPFLILHTSCRRFTITFLLNPKNKLEYLFVILAILNPSTLLLIERLNFDIYIFLILAIVALNRIYIFNWLLFIYWERDEGCNVVSRLNANH